jgi:hypothetical protein
MKELLMVNCSQKLRPELVKEIQKIQESVENLKGIAERLKNTSIEEAIRARDLRGKKRLGTISEEELEELTDLENKEKSTNAQYLKYQEIIDEYTTLLREFSELNDASPSQYYQDELDHQKV